MLRTITMGLTVIALRVLEAVAPLLIFLWLARHLLPQLIAPFAGH